MVRPASSRRADALNIGGVRGRSGVFVERVPVIWVGGRVGHRYTSVLRREA